MKTLMTFSLVALCLTLFAQDIPVATAEQFKRFKESTTYLVKYDDPFSSFDTYMAEDIAKVWKITPYKIISPAEFETLSKDKKNSFIFLSEIYKEEGDKTATWNLLNITLGSNSGSANMNSMPDLGSAPLSYVSEEEDNEDEFLYKLAGVLRFFQYYINYNIENPGSDIKAVVKANKQKLAGKELWLIQSDMADDVNSAEKISKYYSGTVKFVTPEEIRSAIHSGNENVVFLHQVAPGKSGGKWSLKFLISAADGCPLYYDVTTVSGGKDGKFSSADFKAIN
ncbi:hypothetical protein SDC9_59373 [bioreactor metagenome]|uniref:Uncharacterized protein n=1 Tax=bioreactor metagenome TaxID=1076179 RepID=A0A644XB83_9ZZZZ